MVIKITPILRLQLKSALRGLAWTDMFLQEKCGVAELSSSILNLDFTNWTNNLLLYLYTRKISWI